MNSSSPIVNQESPDFPLTNRKLVRPPFNIVRAASAELVVTDLTKSRQFYVDWLGLVPVFADGQSLYLRGYEERVHHSLILRQGPVPGIASLAYRTESNEDLARLREHHRILGCQTRRMEPKEFVGERLQVMDPLGFALEFFHEIEISASFHQRFDLHRGANILALDHFNIFLSDVWAGYKYYSSLGFRLSEYTVTDPPDPKLWGAWLYRKAGVHDVALTNGAGPRLHHIAFRLDQPLSALRICDILASVGMAGAIERGPGRHGVSNAFFLYLRDPDGHRIELYVGDYYTGDPDHEPLSWSLKDPQRGTFWGSIAPPSWFEQGTASLDWSGKPIQISPPRLNERPQATT